MSERASSRSSRRWGLKAAIERVLAALGFVLFAPVMLIVALLVKTTSRGPVLFTSERLGKCGRVFRLYKFRSMRVGVPPILGDDGKVLTIKRDPRLTSIGRLLRLGFDELPQLINVIKGDMCLIGPRPDVPWEIDQYSSRQQRRLQVLPGITGLAQVVGGRSMNNAQNYELDVLYVEHSTWRTDLRILLLTLPYSLGMEQIGVRYLQDYVDAVRPLGDTAQN